MLNSLALETAAAALIAKTPAAEAHLIVKGLQLAKTAGAVVATETPGAYIVNGSKPYTVTPGACSCPARKRCYHRWALNVMHKAGALPTFTASVDVGALWVEMCGR